MGGANSEVSSDTVNIVLESAKFDGAAVRRTSRQLGLRSESSARFEKEVDSARVIPAVDRAAALMASLGNGQVTEGIVQELDEPPSQLRLRSVWTALTLILVQSCRGWRL